MGNAVSMAKQRFQLNITGPRGPEEVSASFLAEFLSRLYAALSKVVEKRGLKLAVDDPIISLVDVIKGSDGLVFSASTAALPAVAIISRVIHTNQYGDVPVETHQELYEISQMVGRKSWGVEFVEDSENDILPARITAGNGVPPVPEPAELKGGTTVLGRCLRVGGVTPKAEIRLSKSERLLYIYVSEEIAKELGKRLYEEVALEGKATWRTDTWEVVRFEVTSVTSFRRTDPHLAIRELAEAAKGQWDKVDAMSFVRGIRGDQK